MATPLPADPNENRAGSAVGPPSGWILAAGAALIILPAVMAAQERNAEMSVVPALPTLPESPIASTTGTVISSPARAEWMPYASLAERTVQLDAPPGPGRTFLASLVLPGSGQWMRGERRAYLYLSAEVAGWLGFAHARRQGTSSRSRYRDLAWRSARLYREGARVVDDFRYYEAMATYTSSGEWDSNPFEPGLQPETDPNTYNGRIWELARGLFLSSEGGELDPEEYDLALEYYRERGFSTELLWEWDPDTSEMAEYRRLIDRSDEGFRRATVIGGAIAANHVLSAVDGFVSTRLGTRIRSSLRIDPGRGSRSGSPGWMFEVRVGGLP